MVVAAKASTLWSVGCHLLRGVDEHLESYRQLHGEVSSGRAEREREQAAIAHIYSHLPASDFSRDLLQYASADSLALPMEGLHWSDWGRPGQIVKSLAHVGIEPHFSAEHLRSGVIASRAASLVA